MQHWEQDHTIGATICLGELIERKKSHPESFGGNECSALHLAAATAFRSSASSLALFGMCVIGSSLKMVRCWSKQVMSCLIEWNRCFLKGLRVLCENKKKTASQSERSLESHRGQLDVDLQLCNGDFARSFSCLHECVEWTYDIEESIEKQRWVMKIKKRSAIMDKPSKEAPTETSTLCVWYF